MLNDTLACRLPPILSLSPAFSSWFCCCMVSIVGDLLRKKHVEGILVSRTIQQGLKQALRHCRTSASTAMVYLEVNIVSCEHRARAEHPLTKSNQPYRSLTRSLQYTAASGSLTFVLGQKNGGLLQRRGRVERTPRFPTAVLAVRWSSKEHVHRRSRQTNPTSGRDGSAPASPHARAYGGIIALV